MKIAIEGCCHGELDNIYNSLGSELPDLLLICGDFQAIRNSSDLRCISIPDKFKKIGDFHKYYNGEAKAPVLTVFIGGNHEASNYLKELKYGGWVAPNIYYLGEYGVIWYKGLRIGGLSGIWYDRDFLKPRFEKVPYNKWELRSIYHLRAVNYLKMFLTSSLDVMLSHDWPQGIEHYGNMPLLLKQKPFFKKDISTGELGSPPNRILLHKLKPRHWFSAHLHVRFEARVRHNVKRKTSVGEESEKRIKTNVDEIDLDFDKENDGKNNTEVYKDDQEIVLDMDDDDGSSKLNKEASEEIVLDMDDSIEGEINLDMDDFEEVEETKDSSQNFISPDHTEFLALDKCLPRRQFLEVIDITPSNLTDISNNDSDIYYDKNSIAINKIIEKFNARNVFKKFSIDQFFNLSNELPELLEELDREIGNEILALDKKSSDFFVIPNNFMQSAPGHGQVDEAEEAILKEWENPQTKQYCTKFGILP